MPKLLQSSADPRGLVRTCSVAGEQKYEWFKKHKQVKIIGYCNPSKCSQWFCLLPAHEDIYICFSECRISHSWTNNEYKKQGFKEGFYFKKLGLFKSKRKFAGTVNCLRNYMYISRYNFITKCTWILYQGITLGVVNLTLTVLNVLKWNLWYDQGR